MKNLKLIYPLLFMGIVSTTATTASAADPIIQRVERNTPELPDETRRTIILQSTENPQPQLPEQSSKVPASSEGSWNLPFSCKFQNSEEFEQNWTVINANNDGNLKKWRWSAESESNPGPLGETDGGYARCRMNASMTADDWLITKRPVSLPQGLCHITFYVIGIEGWTERLKVYYGKTDDVSSMTELIYVKDYNTSEWEFHSQEFTVEEEGNYYFAFYACSEPEKSFVAIDNIFIDKGKFIGNADIAIQYLNLPYSACGLTATEKIGVTFKNKGTDKLTKFSFEYQIDDNNPVSQTFTQTLGVGEETTVYFDKTADFSTEGKSYKVSVKGEVIPQGEEREELVTNNNSASAIVTNYTPRELPAYYDFSKKEDRDQWGSTRLGWIWDDYSGAMIPRGLDPIISRCSYLDKGKDYRITTTVKGGYYLAMMGMTFTDNWDIAVGKVGTPVSSWKVIASRRDIYTEETFITDEAIFECTETGIYNIAFIPIKDKGFICLRNVDMTVIPENDIRIDHFTTSLGRLTPAALAHDPEFKVNVINRGSKNAEEVTVRLDLADKTIDQSSPISIAKYKNADFYLSAKNQNISAGNEITYSLTALMKQQDSYQEDNTKDFMFTTTEKEYAFDHFDETPKTGIGSSSLKLGNIFSLPVPADLSAVKIGWSDLSEFISEDLNATIYIYTVNETGKLGNLFYQTSIRRPKEGGFIDYPTECGKLTAGKWLICVAQDGTENFGIGNDNHPQGVIHAVNGKELSQITGYGFAALRAYLEADYSNVDEVQCIDEISATISGGILTLKAPGLLNAAIFNTSGIAVAKGNASNDTLKIDLNNFQTNIYILHIETADKVSVRKLSIR